ncbi:erythromycin esterase family protein [Deinococcus peraridilitoris]|uniref:Erythromycin esterase-like enzyme n=1 Tax=Deinococcus peraridilitoris (strain DSM 19664 / LMG 22246 / CIP 109416 / KR-200) TaxID=937777 RepID=K9ZZ47_DEIPD|nr:erythromycin esterase family protein [Deinococcus peraridilitoris]AFZ66187.1 erythromycin esterase-like enzyme [Deinococcus peraridilitoris DSM 19664]
MTANDTLSLVRAVARPLYGGSDDYGDLLEAIGDARFVLVGEASHGTHEFYRERARITRRLIEERGFTAVLVEADWPDAYRVNRYVRAPALEGESESSDGSALDALGDFQRFPQWMWRNEDVLHFVEWLREHNTRHAQQGSVGFYGMDLYSLHRSMEAVVQYLDRVDPEAARRARERYACFEDFGHEGQTYGLYTSHGSEPCEGAAVAQLVELQRREPELTAAGALAHDEHFYAEQNARLAQNAEGYYRAMYRGRNESWNLRDTHMADTLDALAEHLESQGQRARIVVWAHNSHLGDARATQMGRGGELNVGQLVRERHPGEVYNIGFSTYTGTVMAADDWGERPKRKRVRPGLRGSYEELLHEVAAHLPSPNFWVNLRDTNSGTQVLREERLQRAIGVIYRPETERWSHYFHASLPEQFDAILHFDETDAVVPLDAPRANRDEEALPDTFPTGQ